MEKRKHKRYTVSIDGKYKLKDWNEQYGSLAKDISRGGFGLTVNEDLKRGTPVELVFPLFGQEVKKPMILRGVVAWSRDAEEGGGSSSPDGPEPLIWKSADMFHEKDLRSADKKFRIGIKLDSELSSDLIMKAITFIPSGQKP
ncbi:PilZ domain-containing protein [Candidatus Omnitrophota bacterium]